ncbi:MAG: sporulation transcriptional regulator SpoIIID [Clostridia bacterium]|nr:sporulation transcriptional regulator SpoIIID [Clostridia bacterium]
MHTDINGRCIALARCVAEKGATVRQAAREVGVSKSLAHRELTIRLKYLDGTLYAQVRKQLLYHKAVRHLRGGEATKRKFAAEKMEKVENESPKKRNFSKKVGN